MGFLEACVVVLLTLKLCGVITVSWWVVFAPMYIGYAAIFLLFVLIPLTLSLLLTALEGFWSWLDDVTRDWRK